MDPITHGRTCWRECCNNAHPEGVTRAVLDERHDARYQGRGDELPRAIEHLRATAAIARLLDQE